MVALSNPSFVLEMMHLGTRAARAGLGQCSSKVQSTLLVASLQEDKGFVPKSKSMTSLRTLFSSGDIVFQSKI